MASATDAPSLTAADVATLIDAMARLGYDDVGWSETLKPPKDAEQFAAEIIFCIINAGMQFAVARGIHERVKRAVLAGNSSTTVFGHAGKAKAIDLVWRDRETYFRLYSNAADKLAFLSGIPWIGSITKYHAARNFGEPVVKPDIHIARLADAHRTTPMDLCRKLADATGLRIGTIDAVLWRASALGILDSRTGKLQLDRMETAIKRRDREAAAFATTPTPD